MELNNQGLNNPNSTGLNNRGSNSLNSVVVNDADKTNAECLVIVFMRMFIALLVTAAIAYAVVTIPSLNRFIYNSNGSMNMVVFWVLLILELGLVIGISAGINSMSSDTANILFFLYATINGLTLSVIFYAYSLPNIYTAFGLTAVMFAVMAGYGAVTHKDLSSIGSICIMGLFGVILASIVNLFLKSSLLDYIVCYVGILVFVGLTAYDTQRIKRMLADATAARQEEAVKKIAVIGALTLYLDFINLFLKILSLMRRR